MKKNKLTKRKMLLSLILLLIFGSTYYLSNIPVNNNLAEYINEHLSLTEYTEIFEEDSETRPYIENILLTHTTDKSTRTYNGDTKYIQTEGLNDNTTGSNREVSYEMYIAGEKYYIRVINWVDDINIGNDILIKDVDRDWVDLTEIDAISDELDQELYWKLSSFTDINLGSDNLNLSDLFTEETFSESLKGAKIKYNVFTQKYFSTIDCSNTSISLLAGHNNFDKCRISFKLGDGILSEFQLKYSVSNPREFGGYRVDVDISFSISTDKGIDLTQKYEEIQDNLFSIREYSINWLSGAESALENLYVGERDAEVQLEIYIQPLCITFACNNFFESTYDYIISEASQQNIGVQLIPRLNLIGIESIGDVILCSTEQASQFDVINFIYKNSSELRDTARAYGDEEINSNYPRLYEDEILENRLADFSQVIENTEELYECVSLEKYSVKIDPTTTGVVEYDRYTSDDEYWSDVEANILVRRKGEEVFLSNPTIEEIDNLINR